MKKILLALFVSVLSFGSGLTGMYFLVPTVAPDRAEAARPDSLSHTDAPLTEAAVADDTLDAEPDPAAPSAFPDLMALTGDSLAGPPASQKDVRLVVMQDSLQALQRRLHEMNTAFTSLQGEAEGLIERVNDFETVQVQTEDLSKTLTKMEDKELRAIVQQLDPEVLATLYKQASGRNRTRLLQALPPTQAAQFVHRLTGASAPTYQNASLPADTTATADEVPSAENTLLDE